MLTAARLTNPVSSQFPSYPLIPSAVMASQMLQMATRATTSTTTDSAPHTLSPHNPMLDTKVENDPESPLNSPMETTDENVEISDPKVTDEEENEK